MVRFGLIFQSAERIFHGVEIGAVAVRGQLDPVRQPVLEIVNEPLSRASVARAYEPTRDQLYVGVESNPRPSVAPSFSLLFVGRVPFLGTDERPDFVALDTLARQVDQRLALVLRARIAKVHQQLEDRGSVDAGHADGCPEKVALDRQATTRTRSSLLSLFMH